MKKQNDLLNGPIFSTLAGLALPLMATSLMQMTYNLTDMLWIGRLGADAVASVGTAGIFAWMSGGLCTLARTGGQVLVGQSLGQNDQRRAGKFAGTALQMGVVISILYGLMLIVAATPLISFFNLTNPEVILNAKNYLRLTGLGMLFTFYTQIMTALVTVTGDSSTPFRINVVGLILNVVLDPLLIFGFGPIPALGVAGAALATITGQIAVALLFLRYQLRAGGLFLQVKMRELPSARDIRRILQISFPAAVQNVLLPAIAMVIARQVAYFGDAAVAVQKVGSQIESVSWSIADGFAMAAGSFTAQNFGANKLNRAKRGFWIALGSIICWGAFTSMLLMVFAKPLFSVFITDPAVQGMGADYLWILGTSQIFMCCEILIVAVFAGFGRTFVPSVICTVLTAARIPLAAILSVTALELCGIWWAISISSYAKGMICFLAILYYLYRKLPKQKT